MKTYEQRQAESERREAEAGEVLTVIHGLAVGTHQLVINPNNDGGVLTVRIEKRDE